MTYSTAPGFGNATRFHYRFQLADGFEFDCAAFLMSNPKTGLKGACTEPNADLAFAAFARSRVAHVGDMVASTHP